MITTNNLSIFFLSFLLVCFAFLLNICHRHIWSIRDIVFDIR